MPKALYRDVYICCSQESEGEDAEAARVVLPSAAPGRAGKALAGHQSRVRLHEVGPRLELEVVKVGWSTVSAPLPCQSKHHVTSPSQG